MDDLLLVMSSLCIARNFIPFCTEIRLDVCSTYLGRSVLQCSFHLGYYPFSLVYTQFFRIRGDE
jgi:hypothetical protein